MAYLNFTTEIPISRTVGEIQTMLADAGADRVMLEYEGRVPTAIRFSLTTQFGPLVYALPCNVDGVWQVLRNQSNQYRTQPSGRQVRAVPERLVNREQAFRVGWRVVKDWLEAQLAIIEAGIVTPEQALLPYQVVENDRTVYEVLVERGMQLKALPAPKSIASDQGGGG